MGSLINWRIYPWVGLRRRAFNGEKYVLCFWGFNEIYAESLAKRIRTSGGLSRITKGPSDSYSVWGNPRDSVKAYDDIYEILPHKIETPEGTIWRKDTGW